MARLDLTNAPAHLRELWEFMYDRANDHAFPFKPPAIQDYLTTAYGLRLAKDLLARPTMCDALSPKITTWMSDPVERDRIIEIMTPYLPEGANRYDRLHLGVFCLESARIFHKFHEELRAKKQPRKPAKPKLATTKRSRGKPPRLDYDLKRLNHDGHWDNLKDGEANLFKELFEANGKWMNLAVLPSNAAHIKLRMKPCLKALIESNRHDGYRIPSLLV